MSDQEQETVEAKVSILSGEDESMTGGILRLIGKKGITIAISSELAKQIGKAQIDGYDGYCEVGTFLLYDGYDFSGEKSVVNLVISDDN